MPIKHFLIVLFFLFPALAFAKDKQGEHKPPPAPIYEELELDRVIDGDTIVASKRKIRLWGIDAPEKDESLYEISSKALALFLETGKLHCKQIDVDRYQRDVMHCYSGDNDVGSLMVKSGFARDFTKYSGGFYKKEEEFAQKSKLGVWE